MDHRSAAGAMIAPVPFDDIKRRLLAAQGGPLTAFFFRNVQQAFGSLHELADANANGYVWHRDGSEWIFNYHAQYPRFMRFGTGEIRKGCK